MPTRDIATAVGFYGETLGIPRSVYNDERHYAEFETGSLTQGV
jgi:predicted enzyme related to lactoylglutathione lyase